MKIDNIEDQGVRVNTSTLLDSTEDECGIESNEEGIFENSQGGNQQVDAQGQCNYGAT
jgi:hypothetical protein